MADSPSRAVFLSPGEGAQITNPLGGPLTFKLRGEASGGAMTMFESEADPGEGPPLHTHAHEAEVLYVLDGRFRFRLGDELHDASAGSFVFVPAGVPHTWQNVGDERSRLLVAFTPSGMERFFDRFGELDSDVEFPKEFARLGGAAGMEAVGPPLAKSHPL